MSRTYIQRVSKELSHAIYYRFTCEQCGKDSGWTEHTITGQGSREGGNIKFTPAGEVSEETTRQVAEEAIKMLTDSMQRCRKDTDKNIYSFRKKCPHCGKPQSWQTKGWFSDSIAAGLGTAVIAGLLIMFARFLFKLPVSNMLHIIITAASFGIAVTAVLIHGASIKVQTKDVKNKRKPEINWNGWKF